MRDRLQASQSRQKAYADRRRRPLEFKAGEHVFLRVTRTTGVGRAIRSRNLSPKFLGSYQILRRIGPVAYEIALPPQLAKSSMSHSYGSMFLTRHMFWRWRMCKSGRISG